MASPEHCPLDTTLAPPGSPTTVAHAALIQHGATNAAPCPAETARRVLGGAPDALAAQFYHRAADAAEARAIAAQLRATASELYALIGAEEKVQR